MRGFDIISEIFISGERFLATTLLTKSLSVAIPTGILSSVITTQPIIFSLMSIAAAKMVFCMFTVIISLVIKSLTDGIIPQTYVVLCDL